MNKKPLKGILFLVPTIVDERGELDLEAYQENIRYLEGIGAHGIVSMASMGHYFLMDHDEFKKVASAARAACNQMTCVIGTHFQNTREAVARTKYAEKIGADGIFILPPYYSTWLDDEAREGCLPATIAPHSAPASPSFSMAVFPAEVKWGTAGQGRHRC